MRLIDADVLKEIIGECPENWTDSPEEVEAFNMWHRIMDDIDSTPTVGSWANVKDRLPEQGATVLTYSPRGRMRVAQAYIPSTILGSHYDPKECWWNLGGNAGKFVKVTHWMSLPEPPKEEK